MPPCYKRIRVIARGPKGVKKYYYKHWFINTMGLKSPVGHVVINIRVGNEYHSLLVKQRTIPVFVAYSHIV